MSVSVASSLGARAPSVLTVDELLLLRGDDAGQMCAELAAALLCLQPGLSLRDVHVAVPLKLGPAFFTPLLICSRDSTQATVFNIWLPCHICMCECSTGRSCGAGEEAEPFKLWLRLVLDRLLIYRLLLLPCG